MSIWNIQPIKKLDLLCRHSSRQWTRYGKTSFNRYGHQCIYRRWHRDALQVWYSFAEKCSKCPHFGEGGAERIDLFFFLFVYVDFNSILPGKIFAVRVNGRQTTLTSKSAMAKFAINWFVTVCIRGVCLTTIKTAMFPRTPIINTAQYATLKQFKLKYLCLRKSVGAAFFY